MLYTELDLFCSMLGRLDLLKDSEFVIIWSAGGTYCSCPTEGNMDHPAASHKWETYNFSLHSDQGYIIQKSQHVCFIKKKCVL